MSPRRPRKPAVLVVGLDLSLRSAAAFSLRDGEPEDSLLVRPDIKVHDLRTGLERLELVYRSMRGFINSQAILQKLTPYVCIEDYAYAARGQAVISLGELGGLMRLWVYEKGYPLRTVAPQRAKKFLTGKGNAGKPLMTDTADKDRGFREIVGDTKRTYGRHDLADAFAIAQFAYYDIVARRSEIWRLESLAMHARKVILDQTPENKWVVKPDDSVEISSSVYWR